MKLVSFPLVAAGHLPLSLPKPTALNSGGFLLPARGGGTQYAYSPLDLLVAGLEGSLMGFFVLDLLKFFDEHKYPKSESLIYLTLVEDKKIIHDSVLGLKSHIARNGDEEMLRVLQVNAPLTFKRMRLL